jgi:DUF4097 and DUF4098 domain-containing protein YvlB
MRKVLAGSLLLWVLSLRPTHAADQPFDRTVPLPAGAALTLQNVNGPVEVRGWDRAEARIQALKRASREGTDLALVEIEVHSSAGRLDISTHYAQDLQGLDVSVEYLLHVPEHTLLEHIATINGSIRIAGMDSTGDLRTVNGNIEAYNCAGSWSAHTTNGSISEELARLAAPSATLETVNGSVTLALAPNASVELDLRSMNGEVHSELPMAVRSGFLRGEVHGKIGGGGPALHVRAVNGGIRLETLKPTV